RAQLQRDPAVTDERGETSELHVRRARADVCDVVDDAHAVSQPLGPAELQRLPDAGQAERLAGVNGDVEVLAPDVVERVEVPRRWVAGLRARDVEPHDPA